MMYCFVVDCNPSVTLTTRQIDQALKMDLITIRQHSNCSISKYYEYDTHASTQMT